MKISESRLKTCVNDRRVMSSALRRIGVLAIWIVTAGAQAATVMGLILALTAGTATAAPEMTVLGVDGSSIINGETVVSVDVGTDFGTATIFAPVERTFTITNSGPDALDLTGTPAVVKTGSDFSVVAQPSTPVAAGGSTPFTVRFLPTATGTRSTTISITNSDALRTPYTFALQGTGARADITVTNDNWTMTMTYNHASTENQVIPSVNYTLNGITYPACKVRMLATIACPAGTADFYAFDVPSRTRFGFIGYWGASRTATTDWVFNASGGTGRFESFIVNMGTYSRSTVNHRVELQVKINGGSFVTVWSFGDPLPLDLSNVGGVNYLQGASSITLRGLIYQYGNDGNVSMMQVIGTGAGLTINASIAQPQGTVIVVR